MNTITIVLKIGTVINRNVASASLFNKIAKVIGEGKETHFQHGDLFLVLSEVAAISYNRD